MPARKSPSLPAGLRTALALLLPPLGAAGIASFTGAARGGIALGPAFAAAGVVSLFLGLNWYGLPGNGLRTGRPLYAGIGFAVLGWLAVLLLRFFLVPSSGLTSGGLGRTFVFLLGFESFSLQLWTFGLLFRSVADWRGPLSAVLLGGLVFGTVGWQFFAESLPASGSGWLFFVVWGWFYALIRLRSGSFLGPSLVQAMQSLTVWHILLPPDAPDPAQYARFYLVASLLLLLLLWRLWPWREDDYRV